MAAQPSKLLTPDDAAEKLGVKVATIAQWRKNKIGPNYVKLGAGNAGVRYRESDIETWLDSNTVTTNGGGHNG